MRSKAKNWLKNTLRWGIAVFGIWYVVSNMSLRDRVCILDSQNRPVMARLLTEAPPAEGKVVKIDPRENLETLSIVDPATGNQREVKRKETIDRSGRKDVVIQTATGPKKVMLLGIGAVDHQLLIVNPGAIDQKNGPGTWVAPEQVVGGLTDDMIYPRIDIGLLHMVSSAKGSLLLLALLVFPVTFILTSYRWHELLKALEIQISIGRTFVLNLVGMFYNSFMPGSTGGDVLKAYYASKVTTHRTRAVMSVVVDRIIGLLALIILGGAMAATQWEVRECRRIAIGSAVIIACTVLGLLVFYQPTLHKLFGLDWIIRKLPMQKQVHHAVGVMMIYRQRPWLVAKSLLMSFPVHMAVIMSTLFAGVAFGLPLDWSYYWAIVPVIVLAGALPISPQGAGVMEYFAIKLTERQHATVSQAFALTMSIRVVSMLWSLVGGLFVLRGGFHAPTEGEKHQVDVAADADDDGDAAAAGAAGSTPDPVPS